MRRVMIGAIVALVLVSVGAWAQTNGTSAFGQLPPGEQKIARALFEAQSTSGGTTPLTLDQIAAKKKEGHTGWGQVFKQMKERNLLTDKNLGQVVSNFERHHPEVAGKPDVAKPDKVEKPDKPEKPEKIEKPARPEKPGR